MAYVFATYHLQGQSILNQYSVQNMTIYGKVKRHLFKNVRSMDTIMRLDDVWLQTTLNTPNISGV